MSKKVLSDNEIIKLEYVKKNISYITPSVILKTENAIKIPIEINSMIKDMEFPSCEEIEKNVGIKILSIEKYIPGHIRSHYKTIVAASGAYILVSEKGKYIGESKNVVDRLISHKYSRVGKILFGYIYVTEKDKKITRKLESYLINKLKPNLNLNRYQKKVLCLQRL